MAATNAAYERERGLRRALVTIAVVATVLGLLHHTDHVIRGNLVVQQGLPAIWNHSGWPFQPNVSPFTISLVIYMLLVGGIIFTQRGHLWAAYWLAAASSILLVISFVHFFPGEDTETPLVIYQTYGGGPIGILANVVVAAIVVTLLVLIGQSIVTRHASGRW